MKLTDGQYNLLVKIGRMERDLGGKPRHCLVRDTEVGFSGYKSARGARHETISALERLGFIHAYPVATPGFAGERKASLAPYSSGGICAEIAR